MAVPRPDLALSVVGTGDPAVLDVEPALIPGKQDLASGGTDSADAV